MSHRCFFGFVLVTATLAGVVACGKRGSPLPPLRPVPTRITDLSAVRGPERITLHFTVPAANLDGTTPVAIDRVDIYRMVTAAGAVPPTAVPSTAVPSSGVPPTVVPPTAAAMTADPQHLLTRIAVRRASEDEAVPQVPADPRPVSGSVASFVDPIDASVAPGGVRYYLVIPVAGSGRGRAGPASPILAVTVGPLPAAPTDLTLTVDETRLTAKWTAAAPGQRFAVYRGSPTFDPASAELLTPDPTPALELAVPVEFGKAVCMAVKAVIVTGATRAEGAASAPECVTPLDRFPPAAPTGLQAVQEDAAVTLIWAQVQAPDLAGYIVLRGDGATENLQPLMRAPIQDATYRDTTVRPGQTYTYAVYAVDSSPAANVSQLSDRQTIIIR